MNPSLHLFLGDGVVGRAAADEAARRGLPVALASRTPAPDARHPHRRVDALDRDGLLRATADVSHLYVTLGLPYDTRTWQRDWPVVIENVVAAARANGCRLVMFDNIYAYGPVPLRVPMREDHPRQPPSAKGRVRQAMEERLKRAARDEGVRLVIGRCADFYGPGVRNSSLYVSAIERQLQGKRANWLGDPDRPHSFTYTLDAARALVELALDDGADGQDWHLPTVAPAPTVRQLLGLSAQRLGAPTAIRVMPRAALAVLSLFVPLLREVREMLYQNEQDYVFSSEKFMARYPAFRLTPYEEGIARMVDAARDDMRTAASPTSSPA